MRCPKCGGTIIVRFLYQYSHDYKVLRNGKLSKRYRKRDCGPLDVAIACCESCGKYWNTDEVFVSQDGVVYLDGEDS